MTNATTDDASAPPPFDPTNVVDLVSVDDSKIINVSLYTGRAEITRLYKFPVKTGHNLVNINGLPNVMDQESLRVEGRGAATIHDVTLSNIPQTKRVSSSAHLDELVTEKDLAEKGLERCEKGLASLEAYVSSINAQHTDMADLDMVIEHYDKAAEKLDKKIIGLEKTIKKISENIEKEQRELEGSPRDAKLNLQAAIGVFAAAEGQVEIALIYAVFGATWKALYDIRADMQTKEKPVRLIYKAAITQDTGEAWDDVPLHLETASPTFGVELPQLPPWTISVYTPRVVEKKSKGFGGLRASGTGHPSALSSYRMSEIVMASESLRIDEEDDEDQLMGHRVSAVSSKGGINATFRVPGTIAIPSDGAAHNVTVAQLDLDAVMSWVTVPKISTKALIKAKIKNASEYTLLPGSASVYVDGSFISKSNVPLVSPQESFDCPLGLDPSVRVVYHPCRKRISQSGFYSRNRVQTFSQRITIHNTKSTPFTDFKVIDAVPVSESSHIVVKLISPALVLPELSAGDAERKPPSPLHVGEGIVAQWEGADEPGFDLEALGKDGKLNWVCSIPSQGKINLLLSWEVVAPARLAIEGV